MLRVSRYALFIWIVPQELFKSYLMLKATANLFWRVRKCPYKTDLCMNAEKFTLALCVYFSYMYIWDITHTVHLRRHIFITYLSMYWVALLRGSIFTHEKRDKSTLIRIILILSYSCIAVHNWWQTVEILILEVLSQLHTQERVPTRGKPFSFWVLVSMEICLKPFDPTIMPIH